MNEKDLIVLRRHRKITWISPSFLKLWINGKFLQYNHMIYPIIPEAENAIVDSVFWSNTRHCFGVVLLDESFPEVKLGDCPPEFFSTMMQKVVEVKQNER